MATIAAAAATGLSIVFDRPSGVYFVGDHLSGRVRVDRTGVDEAPVSLTLTVAGNIRLNVSPKNVGLFEAFYCYLKPTLLHYCTQNLTQLRTADAFYEYPFDVLIEPCEGQELMSTYLGKSITIRHQATCQMKRGMLSSAKSASKEFSFLVQGSPKYPELDVPRTFKLHGRSTGYESADHPAADPGTEIEELDCEFEGQIDRTTCSVRDDPLQGFITIIRSSKAITSIKLHLFRVETCDYSEGPWAERSEVLCIEVACGNVCRGVEIPFRFHWPRLLTCPTARHDDFSVDFEVELRVNFSNGQYMVENFPIRLH